MKNQLGITFIEVLVTAIILGVGMLGIMSLQSTGLQYNQQGYLYSQAIFLANDMADRMRANRTVGSSYQTDVDDGYDSTFGTDCESDSCTVAEMASWDVNEWKGLIEQLLPSGAGSIVQNGLIFSISVQFQDGRIDEDPDPNVVSIADPQSVTITVQP